MAKPKWQVTDAVLKNVEEWASQGVTEESMAEYLGISRSTFIRHKAMNLKLKQAVEDGKLSVIDWAASKLVTIMKDDKHPKQVTCLLFYLKTQAGYREKESLTVNVERPSEVVFE